MEPVPSNITSPFLLKSFNVFLSPGATLSFPKIGNFSFVSSNLSKPNFLRGELSDSVTTFLSHKATAHLPYVRYICQLLLFLFYHLYSMVLPEEFRVQDLYRTTHHKFRCWAGKPNTQD